MFTLRAAESRDFPALLAIDAACFTPAIRYSRRELRQFMAVRGAFTLVAEAAANPAAGGQSAGDLTESPRLAGFILAVGHARGGHIITIDVLPAFRRSGLGRQLLEAAEARLAEQGAQHVQLEAAVDNSAALAFYRRQGYRAVATLPGYYPGGLDGWRLVKELATRAVAAPERG